MLDDIIQKLQELRKTHGNLPVYAAEVDGGGYSEISQDDILFMKEQLPCWASRKTNYPDRINITL